jgi:hypothetical protein
MADGIKALSDASGLSRESIHEIWEQVKLNHARLKGCAGPHDFTPTTLKFGSKYTCGKCGGEVNASDRSWYETGLDHGRRG